LGRAARFFCDQRMGARGRLGKTLRVVGETASETAVGCQRSADLGEPFDVLRAVSLRPELRPRVPVEPLSRAVSTSRRGVADSRQLIADS
ncbi:MAG: hypothetical protein ACREJL_06055, partial [Candidatus Methylomirabilales bacterium]